MDYFSNPVIQSDLECEFSLEDIAIAWTIYGDNQDLVMQYLLSIKSSSININIHKIIFYKKPWLNFLGHLRE